MVLFLLFSSTLCFIISIAVILPVGIGITIYVRGRRDNTSRQPQSVNTRHPPSDGQTPPSSSVPPSSGAPPSTSGPHSSDPPPSAGNMMRSSTFDQSLDDMGDNNNAARLIDSWTQDGLSTDDGLYEPIGLYTHPWNGRDVSADDLHVTEEDETVIDAVQVISDNTPPPQIPQRPIPIDRALNDIRSAIHALNRIDHQMPIVIDHTGDYANAMMSNSGHDDDGNIQDGGQGPSTSTPHHIDNGGVNNVMVSLSSVRIIDSSDDMSTQQPNDTDTYGSDYDEWSMDLSDVGDTPLSSHYDDTLLPKRHDILSYDTSTPTPPPRRDDPYDDQSSESTIYCTLPKSKVNNTSGRSPYTDHNRTDTNNLGLLDDTIRLNDSTLFQDVPLSPDLPPLHAVPYYRIYYDNTLDGASHHGSDDAANNTDISYPSVLNVNPVDTVVEVTPPHVVPRPPPPPLPTCSPPRRRVVTRSMARLAAATIVNDGHDDDDDDNRHHI